MVILANHLSFMSLGNLPSNTASNIFLIFQMNSIAILRMQFYALFLLCSFDWVFLVFNIYITSWSHRNVNTSIRTLTPS
jgi:hypothetical protein